MITRTPSITLIFHSYAVTPPILKYPLKLVFLQVFESVITRAILETLHSKIFFLFCPVVGYPSTQEG